MAVDRRIWPAGEALLDLVYGLILRIPVANRKLGPLLEIDDDGYCHPGSARPVRIGRSARIPEQIASSGFCLADLRHSIFLYRRPMDYGCWHGAPVRPPREITGTASCPIYLSPATN